MTLQELQANLQKQISSTSQFILSDTALQTSGLDALLQSVFGATGIAVTNPSLSTPSGNSLQASGQVTVFGKGPLGITITFTIANGALSFVLVVIFPTLTLSSLASSLFQSSFSFPANLASFGLVDTSFTLDSNARTVTLSSQSSKSLDILGDGRFVLSTANVSVSASYPSGGSLSASATVSGTLQLAGADFDVTATITSSLTFTGGLRSGETITLTQIFKAATGSSLTLPFADLSFSALSASIDTSASSYSFQGQANWNIPTGTSGLQVQASANVSSTVAAGQRNTTGVLAAQLTAGPATFTLSYTLGENTLTGTWNSGGGSLSYTDLAKLLGISASSIQLPSGLPDLGLASATLTIDFSKSTFTLSAQSTTFGEAFFLASKSSSGSWGFALGLALPSPWQFSSLGGSVGQALSALDFLVFINAFFVVASFTQSNFTYPAFPPSAQTPIDLVPGLTFGSQLDLKASANSSNAIAKNLLTILKKEQLDVQASISPNLSQTQLTVELGGAPIPLLPFKQFTLSNPELVIVAQPLTITFQGTFEVPMNKSGSQTLDVGTAMTVGVGGVNISATVTTSTGSLPSPLDFIGVTLDQIGISAGLILEPPGGTFGLQGKFELGTEPADSFETVFAIDPEVIYPVLLYGNFPKLDFRDVFNSTIGKAAHINLPSGFPDVRFENVFISFADPANTSKLPDGTVPTPGFAVSGTLILPGGWSASVDLQINYAAHGILGSASLSPIHLGNGALSITGNGANGGPSFQVKTASSPYFSANVAVDLLKLKASLNMDVEDSGFTFDLHFSVAGHDQFFDCTLKDKSSFSAKAHLDFPLVVSIGPIKTPQTSLNLGTVNVNETFIGSAGVAISSSGISGSISGSFGQWTLPAISINASAADLSNIFNLIINQIRSQANTVFAKLFSDAATWLKAIKSGLITGVGDIVAVGRVLTQFFGKSIPEAATLVYQNLTTDLGQLITLLHGLGASATDAYSILVGLGYSAAQVASSIASVFKTHVDVPAQGHIDTAPVHTDGRPHFDTPHGDGRVFGIHGDIPHGDASSHTDVTVVPHVDNSITPHIDA